MHLGVERPVRDVEAVHGVDERCFAPAVLARAICCATSGECRRGRACLSILKGSTPVRPDRRLDLVVVHERRRAAELAILADALGVEHHHRLAALALHAASRGLPSALVIGQFAQRRHQIELNHLAGLSIELVRRFRSAEGADQLLLGGVPLGLRAAGRARMLVECGDLGRHVERSTGICACVYWVM